jgi:hypothetical protein
MRYFHHYINGLPFVMVPSLFSSSLCALNELMDYKNMISQSDKVLNFMGVLSIGTFIGFAYPVSMPLLAGRYLYRNRVV